MLENDPGIEKITFLKIGKSVVRAQVKADVGHSNFMRAPLCIFEVPRRNIISMHSREATRKTHRYTPNTTAILNTDAVRKVPEAMSFKDALDFSSLYLP